MIRYSPGKKLFHIDAFRPFGIELRISPINDLSFTTINSARVSPGE